MAERAKTGDPEAPRIRKRQKALRQNRSFSFIFNVRLAVQSLPQKYFSFFFSETMLLSRHPASTRGAYRDRHDTRGRDAMAKRCRSVLNARGRTASRGREVVWSWRRDAGAKLSGDDPDGDGG